MKEFKEIIERALNYYIHITSGELTFLKNHGEDTGHLEEHLSQANSALNYIKNFNSNWIKILDKLPEEEGEYLLCDPEDGFIEIGLYDKDRGFCDWYCDPISNWLHDIKYWMPLPEPPEEV